MARETPLGRGEKARLRGALFLLDRDKLVELVIDLAPKAVMVALTTAIIGANEAATKKKG